MSTSCNGAGPYTIFSLMLREIRKRRSVFSSRDASISRAPPRHYSQANVRIPPAKLSNAVLGFALKSGADFTSATRSLPASFESFSPLHAQTPCISASSLSNLFFALPRSRNLPTSSSCSATRKRSDNPQRRRRRRATFSARARSGRQFPSAASFSFCCSARVTFRTRSVNNPTRRWEARACVEKVPETCGGKRQHANRKYARRSRRTLHLEKRKMP